MSVDNLAGVLQYQGKFEVAGEMNRRAMHGMENVLGKEHPDTLMSVYCPVYLLQLRKEYNTRPRFKLCFIPLQRLKFKLLFAEWCLNCRYRP